MKPKMRVKKAYGLYEDFVHLFCCCDFRTEWQFVSLHDRTLEFNGLINKVDLICCISRKSRSAAQNSIHASPSFQLARFELAGLSDC